MPIYFQYVTYHLLGIRAFRSQGRKRPESTQNLSRVQYYLFYARVEENNRGSSTEINLSIHVSKVR